MKTGVARREIKDLRRLSLPAVGAARSRPRRCSRRITAAVRANPKRVVFAEGEEESVIRAAAAFQNSGLGKAILVGREEVIKAGIRRAGLDEHSLEIRVPHSAQEAAPYIDALYKRMQRRGALYRDACAW